MYAVIRRYSGPGAVELFDLLERRKADVEGLIRELDGFVAYTLFRTADGGIAVTVCQDKAGADESTQIVRTSWVGKEAISATAPPEVAEGPVIHQLTYDSSGGWQDRVGGRGAPVGVPTSPSVVEMEQFLA
jgi:hypothetical protein